MPFDTENLKDKFESCEAVLKDTIDQGKVKVDSKPNNWEKKTSAKKSKVKAINIKNFGVEKLDT